MKTSEAFESISTAEPDESEAESEEEYSISNGEASNDEESDRSRAEDIDLGENLAWEGKQIIKSLAVNRLNSEFSKHLAWVTGATYVRLRSRVCCVCLLSVGLILRRHFPSDYAILLQQSYTYSSRLTISLPLLRFSEGANSA